MFGGSGIKKSSRDDQNSDNGSDSFCILVGFVCMCECVN